MNNFVCFRSSKVEVHKIKYRATDITLDKQFFFSKLERSRKSLVIVKVKWHRKAWLVWTKHQPKSQWTPLGWIETVTVSQNPSTDVWPQWCLCVWMGANPYMHFPTSCGKPSCESKSFNNNKGKSISPLMLMFFGIKCLRSTYRCSVCPHTFGHVVFMVK